MNIFGHPSDYRDAQLGGNQLFNEDMFLGTNTAQDLVLETGDKERIRIEEDGEIKFASTSTLVVNEINGYGNTPYTWINSLNPDESLDATATVLTVTNSNNWYRTLIQSISVSGADFHFTITLNRSNSKIGSILGVATSRPVTPNYSADPTTEYGSYAFIYADDRTPATSGITLDLFNTNYSRRWDNGASVYVFDIHYHEGELRITKDDIMICQANLPAGTYDFIIGSLTNADVATLNTDTSQDGNTVFINGFNSSEQFGRIDELYSYFDLLTNQQYGYIHSMDQDVATTSSVQFADLTIDQVNINNGILTYTGTAGNNQIVFPDGQSPALLFQDNLGVDYMAMDTASDNITFYRPIQAQANTIQTTGLITGGQLTVDNLGLNDATLAFNSTSNSTNKITFTDTSLSTAFSIEQNNGTPYMSFSTSTGEIDIHTQVDLKDTLNFISTTTNENRIMIPNTVMADALSIEQVNGTKFITIDSSTPSVDILQTLDAQANTIQTTGLISAGQVIVDNVFLNDARIDLGSTSDGANKITFTNASLATAFSIEQDNGTPYMSFSTATGEIDIHTQLDLKDTLNFISTTTDENHIQIPDTALADALSIEQVNGTKFITIDSSTPSVNILQDLNAGANDIITTGIVSSGNVVVDELDLDDGIITFSGATGLNRIVIPDNQTDGLSIQEGINKYMTFNTQNGYEFSDTLIGANWTSTSESKVTLTSSTSTPIALIGQTFAYADTESIKFSVTTDNSKWLHFGIVENGGFGDYDTPIGTTLQSGKLMIYYSNGNGGANNSSIIEQEGGVGLSSLGSPTGTYINASGTLEMKYVNGVLDYYLDDVFYFSVNLVSAFTPADPSGRTYHFFVADGQSESSSHTAEIISSSVTPYVQMSKPLGFINNSGLLLAPSSNTALTIKDGVTEFMGFDTLNGEVDILVPLECASTIAGSSLSLSDDTTQITLGTSDIITISGSNPTASFTCDFLDIKESCSFVVNNAVCTVIAYTNTATIGVTVDVALVDTTTNGPFTISLPDTTNLNGINRQITVKDNTGSWAGKNLTISRSGSTDLIDGATTQTGNTNWASYTFVSDINNNNWHIV